MLKSERMTDFGGKIYIYRLSAGLKEKDSIEHCFFVFFYLVSN